MITLVIVAVDRITKFYIEEYLEIGETVPVIRGFFDITRVNNIGAAFGMLKGFNILFMAAALAVMVLFVYFYSEIVKENYLIIASSFILGGTVGNLMDRIYFGYVIDYLNLSFWPTFNLSDAFLTIGVFMLMLYLWRMKDTTRHVEGHDRYKRY